jgi:hypothetical protein
LRLLNVNIEVVRLFTLAERFIQSYGGGISFIRLHKNYVRANLFTDAFQKGNQCRGYAPPAMFRNYRQIINVNFLSFLFEFFKDISRQSANDLFVVKNGQDDKIVFARRASR